MKLLIVVDYQNDFVDGSLGFKKATLIEKNIIKKIEAYDNVVFTFDTHDEDYLNSTLEGKKLPVKHCVKGTAGWELYGNVKNYLPKAIKVFTKNTFPSLDLANFLKDKEYDEVEVCGLVSNICVISNAIMVKAALPIARIIVDKNATASFDEKLNEETFDVLKGLQIDVIGE